MTAVTQKIPPWCEYSAMATNQHVRGQRRSQTYHEIERLVDHARAVDDLDDVVGAAVLQHAALDVDVLLVHAHHEVAVQNEAVVGVAKR